MEADEDAPPPAPEIEKELEIRAPIEKVWDALTDGQHRQMDALG